MVQPLLDLSEVILWCSHWLTCQRSSYGTTGQRSSYDATGHPMVPQVRGHPMVPQVRGHPTVQPLVDCINKNTSLFLLLQHKTTLLTTIQDPVSTSHQPTPTTLVPFTLATTLQEDPVSTSLLYTTRHKQHNTSRCSQPYNHDPVSTRLLYRTQHKQHNTNP